MATTRPLGSVPESFDGSPAKAREFLSALTSYYFLNSDIYNDNKKKVGTALTFFKVRTRAGDWAKEQQDAAEARNPAAYRTWDEFQDDFKKQFLPPISTAEYISKMNKTSQGNREFNE